MTVRTIGVIVTITVGFFANSASAQGDPKVGITMGYPGSIGVIWKVTDRVALRPEVNVQKSSGESTSTLSLSITAFPIGGTSTTTTTTVTTIDAWQVSAGLSALFYLTKGDALRTYVSPRWAYSRSSSGSSGSSSSLSELDNALTFGTSTHTVAGSFGAQYAIARRFNVFGEVGGTFTRSANTPQEQRASPVFSSSSRTVSRSFGARSGAGVILYF
jgi:hypothetical protein